MPSKNALHVTDGTYPQGYKKIIILEKEIIIKREREKTKRDQKNMYMKSPSSM